MLDRVVADLARMKPMGLRFRCVMSPGSSVAAGVHCVLADDKDAPVRSTSGSQWPNSAPGAGRSAQLIGLLWCVSGGRSKCV